jgi:hypothetical protein
LLADTVACEPALQTGKPQSQAASNVSSQKQAKPKPTPKPTPSEDTLARHDEIFGRIDRKKLEWVDEAPRGEKVNTRRPRISFEWAIDRAEVFTPESSQALREIESILKSLRDTVSQKMADLGDRDSSNQSMYELVRVLSSMLTALHDTRDNGYSQQSVLEVSVRYLTLMDLLARGGVVGKSVMEFDPQEFHRILEYRMSQMDRLERKIGDVLKPRVVVTLVPLSQLDLIRARASGTWLLHLPVLNSINLRLLNPWKLWEEQWKRIMSAYEQDKREFLEPKIGKKFLADRKTQNEKLKDIYNFLVLNELKPVGRLIQRFYEMQLIENGRTFGYLQRNFTKRFFRKFMKAEIEFGQYSESTVNAAEMLLEKQIEPSFWNFLHREQ